MGSKQATAGEDLGLLIEGKHLCNQIHLSFTVSQWLKVAVLAKGFAWGWWICIDLESAMLRFFFLSLSFILNDIFVVSQVLTLLALCIDISSWWNGQEISLRWLKIFIYISSIVFLLMDRRESFDIWFD